MEHDPHPEVRQVWDKLRKYGGAMHDRAGNVTTTTLNVIRKTTQGAIKCGATDILDHPVLLPDGRLSLCCCDYSLANIVGNLLEKPLTEILRDEPIRSLLHIQRVGQDCICRNCSIAVPA